MATLKTITEPTVEPVTLDELKDVLRIDGTDDDKRLYGLIKTARSFAEQFCNLRLMTQTVELIYDRWPSDTFELDVWPIQSVDSVKYDDTASPQVQQTLVVDDDYIVEIESYNGRITSLGGWPSVSTDFHSIRIRMTVGYSDAESVPETIKDGVKFYAAGLFDCDNTLMETAKTILWPYRNLDDQ